MDPIDWDPFQPIDPERTLLNAQQSDLFVFLWWSHKLLFTTLCLISFRISGKIESFQREFYKQSSFTLLLMMMTWMLLMSHRSEPLKGLLAEPKNVSFKIPSNRLLFGHPVASLSAFSLLMAVVSHHHCRGMQNPSPPPPRPRWRMVLLPSCGKTQKRFLHRNYWPGPLFIWWLCVANNKTGFHEPGGGRRNTVAEWMIKMLCCRWGVTSFHLRSSSTLAAGLFSNCLSNLPGMCCLFTLVFRNYTLVFVWNSR